MTAMHASAPGKHGVRRCNAQRLATLMLPMYVPSPTDQTAPVCTFAMQGAPALCTMVLSSHFGTLRVFFGIIGHKSINSHAARWGHRILDQAGLSQCSAIVLKLLGWYMEELAKCDRV